MELPGGNLLKIGPLTLTDLDGDGFLDVVGSTAIDLEYSLEAPLVSIKDRRSIYAWSLDAPYREDLLPWATYQKDAQRSGRFGKTILINQPPIIRPILSQTVAQGSVFFPINLLRFGSDPDHGYADLTWSIGGVTDLQVSIDENQIVSISPPNVQWTGEEHLIFTLKDPSGAKAQKGATFKVLADYSPPEANLDLAETEEDTPILISVLSNDRHPENLPLKVIELSPPLNGQANLTDQGEINYLPKSNHFGTDTLQYVIIDNEGGMDIGEVQVVIHPINDAPVAEIDRIILTEDGSVEFDPLVNDTDPDEDAIRLIEWTQPIHGTMEQIESGLFRYIPEKDYFGSDGFTYVIEDELGIRSEGKVIYS